MVLTVLTAPGLTEVRRSRICSEPSLGHAVVVRSVFRRPVVVARQDLRRDDVEALVPLVLEALGVGEAACSVLEHSVSCQRSGDLNRSEASTEFAFPNRILDHPNPIVAVTLPPPEPNKAPLEEVAARTFIGPTKHDFESTLVELVETALAVTHDQLGDLPYGGTILGRLLAVAAAHLDPFLESLRSSGVRRSWDPAR